MPTYNTLASLDYPKSWLAIVFLGLMVITLTSQPVRAAGPWYVTPGGDDANDCLSPASPCATINGALSKPGFVAGDIIQVAIGTFTGSGNEVVLLDIDATLSGGWDGALLTSIRSSARRRTTVASLSPMLYFQAARPLMLAAPIVWRLLLTSANLAGRWTVMETALLSVTSAPMNSLRSPSMERLSLSLLLRARLGRFSSEV